MYQSEMLADPLIDPLRRYICRHVHTRGNRCGSPALRGEQFCYYHTRVRHEAPCADRLGIFTMPRVEDRAAIQLALYEVLSRLSSGDIDYKRGAILLNGLKIASANLGRPDPEAITHAQVERITRDYDLGDLAPITAIPDSAEVQITDEIPTAAAVAEPEPSALRTGSGLQPAVALQPKEGPSAPGPSPSLDYDEPSAPEIRPPLTHPGLPVPHSCGPIACVGYLNP